MIDNKIKGQVLNLGQIGRLIEEICPLSLMEDWDNSGYQIKLKENNIKNILVALDITKEVIEEAITNDVDIIITHHPLFFSSVKKIDYETQKGNYIISLIKNNISLYALHTNFDKLDGGNNDYLGELLELKNITYFKEDDSHICRKGNLDKEITIFELLDRISKNLNISKKSIRFCGVPSKKVKTIGWCTGAGSSFLDEAYREGIDLFITGDLTYHKALDFKEQGLNILDIGHYGSENIFIENFSKLLRLKLDECCIDDVNIIESKVNHDPFSHIF